MNPVLAQASPLPSNGVTSVIVYQGIAYVSGQLPRVKGKLYIHGKVGDEVDLPTSQNAARICAQACLDKLAETVGEENIVWVLKLTGFVASATGFNQQGAVIDSASNVFIERLGARAGSHARSSIGVAELPQNAPVEVDLVAAVRTSDTEHTAT
jgi:enamine deaminase RidA (YjgF/YER057c/UK114 family)